MIQDLGSQEGEGDSIQLFFAFPGTDVRPVTQVSRDNDSRKSLFSLISYAPGSTVDIAPTAPLGLPTRE